MQALGIGEVENDFGAGCLPCGSKSAEFTNLESERDLLRFRRRNSQSGVGGPIIVNVDPQEDAGSEKAKFGVSWRVH